MDKPILTYIDKEAGWIFEWPQKMYEEGEYNFFNKAAQILDDDPKFAEEALKMLIQRNPYHIDAYNYLSRSFYLQQKNFESILTAEKAYNLVKSFFPKEFDNSKDLLPWFHIENRPALRAFYFYGAACYRSSQVAEAIQVYRECLALNPHDNQGIRYILLEILLKENLYKEAKELLEYYPDEYSIQFAYGLVSIYALEGNHEKADEFLAQAIEVNPHFVREAAKNLHYKPKTEEEDEIELFGSKTEAYNYWRINKVFYSNEKVKEYYKSKSKK